MATSPVAPGGVATLSARVSAAAVVCSITVVYKSGPSQASGLFPNRPSSAGTVAWTWNVGSNTTLDRWPITVSCGPAGTLHNFFQVGRGPATSTNTNSTGAPEFGRTVLLGKRTKMSACTRGAEPDRRCSPGAYYSKLTKAVICAAGFHTGAIRDVPDSETSRSTGSSPRATDARSRSTTSSRSSSAARTTSPTSTPRRRRSLTARRLPRQGHAREQAARLGVRRRDLADLGAAADRGRLEEALHEGLRDSPDRLRAPALSLRPLGGARPRG